MKIYYIIKMKNYRIISILCVNFNEKIVRNMKFVNKSEKLVKVEVPTVL